MQAVVGAQKPGVVRYGLQGHEDGESSGMQQMVHREVGMGIE